MCGEGGVLGFCQVLGIQLGSKDPVRCLGSRWGVRILAGS